MQPNEFTGNAAGKVVRQPTGYWAFVPIQLPRVIEWTVELVAALSAADQAVGELAGLGRSLANPDLLIQPFVRREAVQSSQIEGTRASLSDLYAYEAGQLSLFELPDDVREVENYVQAMKYGLQRLDTLPISLRFIRELHERLLRGVRGEQWTPGEFRRSQNWIGVAGSTLTTARYIPPPVEAMKTALYELEAFVYADSLLPPLIRVALIHYQFEAIHPFLDGNGRIGRLLVNFLLTTWDVLPHPLLYISAYFNQHCQAYYDHLLAVSQTGAWEQWLRYFLEAVRSQAVDSVTRIGQLQTLQKAYRERFQNRRAAARLLQAVDWLFVQPLFTVQQFADALGVNYATAQRYVTQVEAEGIVREITGQARNRVFAAEAIIQAVSE
jgi:Fic family protein